MASVILATTLLKRRNNEMRKISVVLAALLLVAAFAFAGCGTSLSGKYVLKEAIVDGQTVTLEELMQTYDIEGAPPDMSLQFSGDKVTMTTLGQSAEGTYQIDGDKIIVSGIADDQEVEFTMKDGKIHFEQSEGTMVFVK